MTASVLFIPYLYLFLYLNSHILTIMLSHSEKNLELCIFQCQNFVIYLNKEHNVYM